MGQTGAMPQSAVVEGRVLVAAPSAIRFAEVLRSDAKGGPWNLVGRWNTMGLQFDATFRDADPPKGSAVYYLRVELVVTTGGRVARAWSSPVWLQ